MKYELGFIGAGNMGGAVLEAAAKKIDGSKIAVYTKSGAGAKKYNELLGCHMAQSATEIAKDSKYVIIGVKPHIIPSVAEEIAPVLAERKDNFVLMSMAGGVDTKLLEKLFGHVPVLRIMPNTPCLVGEGMTLYCGNDLITEDIFENFLSIFEAAGRFDRLEERLIDAASAVTGCGPAFAYMFAEALGDGVLSCGVPRKLAYEYAAQMMIGAGKMILETGEHPGRLKDGVCSPGGATIQGVRALEKGAFRSAVFEAVVEAYIKTTKLAE